MHCVFDISSASAWTQCSPKTKILERFFSPVNVSSRPPQHYWLHRTSLCFRRWTWRTWRATSRASWACLTEGSSTVASWKLSSAGSRSCDSSSSLVVYLFLCLPRPALLWPHPLSAAWQHNTRCMCQTPPPPFKNEWQVHCQHRSFSLNPYFLTSQSCPWTVWNFHLLSSALHPWPFLASSLPMLCPNWNIIAQKWPANNPWTLSPASFIHTPTPIFALDTIYKQTRLQTTVCLNLYNLESVMQLLDFFYLY